MTASGNGFDAAARRLAGTIAKATVADQALAESHDTLSRQSRWLERNLPVLWSWRDGIRAFAGREVVQRPQQEAGRFRKWADRTRRGDWRLWRLRLDCACLWLQWTAARSWRGVNAFLVSDAGFFFLFAAMLLAIVILLLALM